MGHIAVIGAGSWGTALACLLREKEYDVTLWALENEVADEINNAKTNSLYFPGVTLPPDLRATSSLERAVREARYILNVVPTQFTRPVFIEAARYINQEAVIVSASKGIEQGTLLTVSGVLREVTGQRVAALSGPSFAKEVIRRFPTAVTLERRTWTQGCFFRRYSIQTISGSIRIAISSAWNSAGRSRTSLPLRRAFPTDSAWATAPALP